ncbi:MAG TPA: DnaJ domain-containing protein [Xanthobacteraceae bacterium]|jgi:curved DNA-binding protein CbpA
MKTLYDVLNVRVDDDAESVRKAFRKAVKANHPDLNAGDPGAQSRFAQIVRANAILRDPELRVVYDRMLEFERQRGRPQSKLVAIFNAAHSIAANAISGFVLAFVLAGGGYKLFTYPPMTSGVTARESVTVAAIPPLALVDVAGQLKSVGLPKLSAAALGAPVDIATDVKTAVDAVIGRPKATAAPAPPRPIIAGKQRDEPEGADVVAPNGQAPTANGDVAEASPFNALIPTSRLKDARFYRERGVASYRSGDFSLAIADFDQAIRLDPNSEAAYVERGIALYRMGEFGRALADIVRAKRMENSRLAATLLSKPRKARSALN